MLKKVDINCDMGEVCINTGKNIDEAFMPFISSCNIATGAHAGDLETMVKTMYLANHHKVAIGIHPSYVDREHFGRVSRNVTKEALAEQLLRQFDVFLQITEKLNFKINHCKPHGALYHDLSSNEMYAEILIGVIQRFDSNLTVYGMSGSKFAKKVIDSGLKFKNEVFADRKYRTGVQLMPRTEKGSVLDSKQAVEKQLNGFIKDQKVELEDASHAALKIDTICIHSDTPNANLYAKTIKQYLDQSNVEVGYNL